MIADTILVDPAIAEAPLADTTSGTVAGTSLEFDVGQYNDGVKTPEPAKKETPAVQTQVQPQTQTKEERHASQKITDLSEKRLKYARLAVDSNADAIYAIAETEPEVAEKLLKEYDFGTEDLQELLLKKENPKADPAELKQKVETDKRLEKMETKLLNEVISKLQKEHPDLKDELEETFRKVYSNPEYEPLDEDRKVEIARAITGKTKSSVSQDTMVGILKAQEGTTSAPKGVTVTDRKNKIPGQSFGAYKAAGVSEADMERYLPEGLDDYIGKLSHIKKDVS